MDSNACTRVIDLPSPSTLTLSLSTTLFTIDCERFMHGWACVGQALAPTRRERILLDGSATDEDSGSGARLPPKTHDEVTTPHSKIASMALYSSSLKVSSHVNCHGTWAYGNKMHQHHKWHVFNANDPPAQGKNCVRFTVDDRYRPSHFVLHGT